MDNGKMALEMKLIHHEQAMEDVNSSAALAHFHSK